MEKSFFNVRVYGLLINKQQEILLSDEEEFGKRFVKFPGGGLEFGEGLIDGLKREFLEECDLAIEVVNHFYTTDFFVESIFGGGQLISIYYTIMALQEITFKLGDFEFDFNNQEISAKQSFRFVAIKDLDEKQVTFPVDQHVVKLLKEKYL